MGGDALQVTSALCSLTQSKAKTHSVREQILNQIALEGNGSNWKNPLKPAADLRPSQTGSTHCSIPSGFGQGSPAELPVLGASLAPCQQFHNTSGVKIKEGFAALKTRHIKGLFNKLSSGGGCKARRQRGLSYHYFFSCKGSRAVAGTCPWLCSHARMC